MHYKDAVKLREWATEEEGRGSPLCSLHARHSIMSVIFASEALINRVIAEFSKVYDPSNDRIPVIDKWHQAPKLCIDAQTSTFNKGTYPFQSFRELVDIRNYLVHPKNCFFTNATIDPQSTISIDGKVCPWIETDAGEKWPITKIPKNPFEISSTDANKAISILDSMVEQLNDYLYGKMHDGWLDEVTIKNDEELTEYKVPLLSLWGGYRPKR